MIVSNELLIFTCSKCGTRVNREDTRCPNCGAELKGFKNDENDFTVTIKTFMNEVDAEMAESLLKESGLECHLKGGSSRGTIYTSHPIELVVLEKDSHRAREL